MDRYRVGLPLWLAGNTLASWGLLTLGLAASFGGDGALIRHGPYRYSRNPQYLGFMISLVGWGILSGSPLTIAASLFGIVPLILVAFAEEPWLAAKYPIGYQDYKHTVTRFFVSK